MKLLKKLLIGLALCVTLLLGWWIGSDNSDTVPVVLLGFELGSYPLGTWTLFVFGLGVVLGIILTLPPWLNSQRLMKRYRTRLSGIERKKALEASRLQATNLE